MPMFEFTCNVGIKALCKKKLNMYPCYILVQIYSYILSTTQTIPIQSLFSQYLQNRLHHVRTCGCLLCAGSLRRQKICNHPLEFIFSKPFNVFWHAQTVLLTLITYLFWFRGNPQKGPESPILAIRGANFDFTYAVFLCPAELKCTK